MNTWFTQPSFVVWQSIDMQPSARVGGSYVYSVRIKYVMEPPQYKHDTANVQIKQGRQSW